MLKMKALTSVPRKGYEYAIIVIEEVVRALYRAATVFGSWEFTWSELGLIGFSSISTQRLLWNSPLVS
jgi:hypothetical protein